MNGAIEVKNFDATDSFVFRALNLTYLHLVQANKDRRVFLPFGIPSMDDLIREFPDHFLQEFSLEVISKDQYSMYGSQSREEFAYRLNKGEYNQLIPKPEDLKGFVYWLQLCTLIPETPETFKISNVPISEAW